MTKIYCDTCKKEITENDGARMTIDSKYNEIEGDFCKPCTNKIISYIKTLLEDTNESNT